MRLPEGQKIMHVTTDVSSEFHTRLILEGHSPGSRALVRLAVCTLRAWPESLHAMYFAKVQWST